MGGGKALSPMHSEKKETKKRKVSLGWKDG